MSNSAYTSERGGDTVDTFAAASPTVERHVVGAEQAPLLVLDGLMRHPEALRQFAARAVGFRPLMDAGNFYPGVRAPAPRPMCRASTPWSRP